MSAGGPPTGGSRQTLRIPGSIRRTLHAGRHLLFSLCHCQLTLPDSLLPRRKHRRTGGKLELDDVIEDSLNRRVDRLGEVGVDVIP